MTERRKSKPGIREKASPLPPDYLKMVTEVFTSNFSEGMAMLAKHAGDPRIEATGAIYPEELILSVSIIHEGQLAATTAHASVDFDARASSPTIQDLLGLCVDALGSVYGEILDPSKPDRIEQVADHSLSAMENIPFEWMSVKVEKREIFVKVDKSNPKLDDLADNWLAKHDPNFVEELEEEERETEKLFVTGPKGGKASGDPGRGGSVH